MSARTRRLSLVALVAALLAAILGAPSALASATASQAGGTHAVLVWGGALGQAERAVHGVGAEPETAVNVVRGVTAHLSAAQEADVTAAGLHVTRDTPMAVTADASAPATTPATPVADHQFAAINPGNDWDLDAGAGIGVALVDTGVTEVADLRGRVVYGPDLSGEGTTTDSYGHGTFMAGLIAGDGQASANAPSRHVGVAPGSHIVSVKVAGADGSTSLLKVLRGIAWAIENGDQYNIRVLNLSVSGPAVTPNYLDDPLSVAVEAAWSSGITVVAAAGNSGDVVGSPGRDPWIVTVGALDTGRVLGPQDDSVPAWSSRSNKGHAKPELLAPGVSVISTAAPSSTVALAHPESAIDGAYMHGSGTSMATAITSGAVAVLTEHHAAATPDDFKGALVNTSTAVGKEIGGAINLGAADLATLDAGNPWWQSHRIAFGEDNEDAVMPWARDWAGTRWAGTRWAGTRWAGTRWAEATWTGTRWADASFAGTRWAGTRWAGTRWAGTRWAGTRWAGTRWADAQWAGTRWAGTRWAGTRWAGTRWAGTRWADAQWTGTRWADLSWADAGWTGNGSASTEWADQLP